MEPGVWKAPNDEQWWHKACYDKVEKAEEIAGLIRDTLMVPETEYDGYSNEFHETLDRAQALLEDAANLERVKRDQQIRTDGGSTVATDRNVKPPKTQYGMRYCRACGWVEAVCGTHPETGPKPTCPNCGPFGPGLFASPEEMVNYDHESAVLKRAVLSGSEAGDGS
jgi:hypothetical protein